ncbi:MAG: class I SAM-dependent methyltransferase [Candidatus Omnitrophica bacterium]|nr:class I SAM-dependent methyltransferase [Candidatus Omnitrophota bacterium]
MKGLETDILNQDFISIVEEFRDFMSQLEEDCLTFDKQNLTSTKAQQIEFVKAKKDTYKTIDLFFYKLWLIAKNFTKTEFLQHQKFIQQELLDFFMQEAMPLNHRIYTKPLGYPGDYLMMNYYYEDGYSGVTAYAKLLDKYTLSIPIARAHIQRRDILKNKILDVLEKRKEQSTSKIASFACGPAIEMLDVLKEGGIPANAKFLCVDGEQGAIDQIKNNVSGIEEENKQRIDISFMTENVLQMVRKKIVTPELVGQDFIYCAGFFDYLADRTLVRFVRYIFDLLKPGGIFVGANIYKEHFCQVYLEMLGEWYLVHRDEESMKGIARDLGASEVSINFDPETKTNIFLTIKK